MSVRVILIGRLGNNLFEYALGRIIAEHFGMQLDCIQVQARDRSILGHRLYSGESATLEGLSRFFPNAPMQICGVRLDEPAELHEIGQGRGWRGHSIDLNGLLSNPLPRKICLRGWFQRFDYYAAHRERIRSWFRPEGVADSVEGDKNDVLVNIRRGADYGIKGWTVPLSYYERVLDSLTDVGKVYVCGTCIDGNVKKRLARFRPIYFNASAIEHFAFIMKFKRIVLSNSTFAWWAAFLSNADQVFAPKFENPDVYSFSGYHDVDLHMRENRYTEVSVKDAVPFGILSRNTRMNVKLSARGLSIVRDGQDEGAITPVNEHQRELCEWMFAQRGVFVLGEVTRLYPSPQSCELISRLIRQEVLLLAPLYMDKDL